MDCDNTEPAIADKIAELETRADQAAVSGELGMAIEYSARARALRSDRARLSATEKPFVWADTLREANILRQAEWDQGNVISLTYRGNELAGEAGEACNVMKKIERERLGIAGSRATINDLADELADIVICADLVALSEGLPLKSEWRANTIPLSLRGCNLASAIGYVCLNIRRVEIARSLGRSAKGGITILGTALGDVMCQVIMIAEAEGVDLVAAVDRKFNATSEKVGLKTRMRSQPTAEGQP
jgi:NTP pyrophosphatase (non-canonical NTP hydrolase)